MRVGQRHGLDLVVCDVDHGGAEAGVEASELDAHWDAQRGVEVGEGLVEKERPGAAHDGAADGDALALAAGELAWGGVQEAGSISSMRAASSMRARIPFGGGGSSSRPKARFCADGHVRIEGVGLKHHGDVAVGAWTSVTRFPSMRSCRR